ncbi:uncharacterized protein [Musca autumnalis]|uniref:uncharacterized protein n=1 Tax=Musca autumnalis TaxID=221902 RepID=UPI003CEDB857
MATDNKSEEKLPLVIGVSILDITMSMIDEIPPTMDGAMYHGISAQSAGGVGRNLAEVIYKLYGKVNFFSIVGDDVMGEILLKRMPEALRCNVHKYPGGRTSSCNVIVDKKGDCKLILGDMEIHDAFDYNCFLLPNGRKCLEEASVIIIDANLPLATIQWILQQANRSRIPVFYEPTDLRIAGKIFSGIRCDDIYVIRLTTPNYAELQDIVKSEFGEDYKIDKVDLNNIEETLKSVKRMLKDIDYMFDCVVVTLGQTGIVLSLNSSVDPYTQSLFRNQKYIFEPIRCDEFSKQIIFFPTPSVVKDVVSVSGAGDSFAGGFISGLLKEYTVTQSIGLGFYAAKQALKTAAAVPEEYYPPGWEECDLWQWQIQACKKRGCFNEKLLS